MYHPASREKKLQLIWIINMLQLVKKEERAPTGRGNTSIDLGIKRRNISTDLSIRRSRCLRTCIGIDVLSRSGNRRRYIGGSGHQQVIGISDLGIMIWESGQTSLLMQLNHQ